MLAHHGACCRERVVASDEIYSACSVSVLDKSYVSRDVNVRRTLVYARYLLAYALVATACSHVALIVSFKHLDAVEHVFGCIVADSAVCCIVYELSSAPELFERFRSSFSIEYLLHEELELRQAFSARHAFCACLVS